MVNRRDFLKLAGKSAFTAWAGSSFLMAGCHTEEDMMGKPNWIVEGSFDTPFVTPSKLFGSASLTAQRATANLLPNVSTPTLSYAGNVLGPTLEADAGELVKVSLQNNLGEPTNIHWHGLLVPADMDGHPEDLAQAGQSLNYQFSIQQRAGTYWYHPHPHEATARQVFMGLAGMFIVRDEEERALNLPSGDFELPIIIQDKRFAGSSLLYAPTSDEIMTGYLGETILVNGVHAPVADVKSGWYRLRLLNGSTARVYQLGFSNGHEFFLIGNDGGLLAQPSKLNRIMLAPGERADVLVNFGDLGEGSEFFLTSSKFSEFNLQGRQEFKVMKFRVTTPGTNSFQLPTVLSSLPSIPLSSATQTRNFDITTFVGGAGHGSGSKHGINGMIYEKDHMAFQVKAGSTEIWEFDNTKGDEIHPMHVHAVQFQVLSREGGRNQIFPSEKGWKDTVMVMPKEKVSVIMKFPDHLGMFVLHCHNLEHEDDGMMLNYMIS